MVSPLLSVTYRAMTLPSLTSATVPASRMRVLSFLVLLVERATEETYGACFP